MTFLFLRVYRPPCLSNTIRFAPIYHSQQAKSHARTSCLCLYIFVRFFSNGNIQCTPFSYIGTKLASTSRLSLQAKHQAALLVLVLACTPGMLRSGRLAVALRSRQKYGFTLTLQHLNSSQRLRYALYEEFISKTNWTKCAYTSYRMLPCHILPPPPIEHAPPTDEYVNSDEGKRSFLYSFFFKKNGLFFFKNSRTLLKLLIRRISAVLCFC